MNENARSLNAVQLLAEIKKIFDRRNLEYWLDAGTLLGAVRHGKFIRWDKDIDLGTWYENIPKLRSISHELQNRGFEIFLDEYRHEFIVKNKKCKLEFFLYRLTNKKATWTLFIPQNWVGANLASLHLRLSADVDPRNSEDQTCLKENLKRPITRVIRMLPASAKKTLTKICFFLYEKIGSRRFLFRIPAEYFTNLSKIEFYGMKFKSPSNVERYLALRYGERWHIPDRNWIYYKDIPRLALERETTVRLRKNRKRKHESRNLQRQK